MALILENVSKSYGGNPVIKALNLNLKPGEITSIVGPSGGGKTTVLRLASGLEQPNTGSIKLDGRAICGSTRENKWLYPKLTVVFQQFFLWPHFTNWENVHLPIKNEPGGKRIAEEMFDRLDVADLKSQFPNEISVGQRQRVALARAVALKPQYLLLDEITSALDVRQIARIRDLLLELRSSNVGILLVTHLLGLAHQLGDHVYYLGAGKFLDIQEAKSGGLGDKAREVVESFQNYSFG